MELRHLRYFVALADQLNFTRAANLLHVAQSTLSHQIGQLEIELGVVLFQRNARRVRLTSEGELFLDRASEALAVLDAGMREISTPMPALTGEVRVGATPTFVASILPDAIALLSERHPSVRAVIHELTTEQIREQLLSRELDLGIAYPPLDSKGLSAEVLFREEMVVLAPPSHPLTKKRLIRLSDLHGQGMVFPTRRFSIRKTIEDSFHAARSEPRVVAEVDSFEASLRLIATLGIVALIPVTIAKQSTRFIAIPIERPFVLREPTLYRPSAVRSSDAVKEMRGLLRRLGRTLDSPPKHRPHR